MFFRHKFSLLFILTLAILAIGVNRVNAELNIPLPVNTEEVKKETRMLANLEYEFTYYTSASGENQIKDFYRQQLPNLGWKEKKLLNELKELKDVQVDANWDKVLGQNLIFEKDTDTLTITFLPAQFSQQGKTQFTLAQGKSLLAEGAKEGTDFIPALVAKPQKDVFPVYPGASLMFLSEPADAIRATYYSKDDINAVAEFYKAKMLNYGWSLIDEKAPEKMDTAAVSKEGISKYCPACAEKAMDTLKSLETWVAHLSFSHQSQDSCNIGLYQVITDKTALEKLKMTTIVVNYAEKNE